MILGDSQFHIALLFGALASATAPAGTAAVFWENKCKGILTTTTMFILALDDIVAILLTDFALDKRQYRLRFHSNYTHDSVI
jgi:hypothetical protein